MDSRGQELACSAPQRPDQGAFMNEIELLVLHVRAEQASEFERMFAEDEFFSLA